MTKKIVTSTKSDTFNSLVECNTNRLTGLVRFADKDDPKHISALVYQLGFTCGVYKAAYDTSPGSVKYDEKEMNDTILKLITTRVSKNKDDFWVNFYFGGLLSDTEAYKKATSDEALSGNITSKLLGDAAVLAEGFAQGYIAGIKDLCADSKIPFQEPRSETSCILKNWKFFFLPIEEKNEFTIDGKFFWGTNAVVEEDLNLEVYAKLKKRPLGDFRYETPIADLSEFL